MDAIYARQSIDKKDSISIETQINLCKKELADGTAFAVYTDKGFSGKNTNRPEFQRLMNDVAQGKINRIIVYRLDRISRSISDFAGFMNKLEDRGVSFTSVTEKFDTSAPMGRAMLYIIMVFAQLERETIAERIRDNYYSRGKLGVWLGGPAPFGFKLKKSILNGKKISSLEMTEDIAVVEDIFDKYCNSSVSLGSIAKELKAKYGDKYGIWNSIKLARIMHNPIYVKANADVYSYYKELGCIFVNSIDDFDGTHGLALYGKRDKNENKYTNLYNQIISVALTDGVIDPKVFLSCQYKMSKNKQIKNSGKGKHTWMTGLMKCPDCGYSLGVKCYNDIKYLYCSGRQNNECTAPRRTLFLEDTEALADSAVLRLLEERENSGETSSVHVPTTAEENRIKIEIHKINEKINNLIDALASAEGVAMEYINKKIAELDNEKQALLEQEAEILYEPIPDYPTPEEWRNADLEEKRILAHNIIDKIYVHPSYVDIVWKY